MEGLSTFLTRLDLSQSTVKDITDQVAQVSAISQQTGQDSTTNLAALVMDELVPTSVTKESNEDYILQRDVNWFVLATIDVTN